MGRKLRVGQPVGARSASGRKRDRTPLRVSPCDGVARRQALYGMAANDTDTCDAIGRAFNAGLLGEGEAAMKRLNAGRRVAARYWRVLGFPTADSLARFQPISGGCPLPPDEERRRETELNGNLDALNAEGRDVRRAFDQLVIDPNPDHGPPWLDRLIWAEKRGQTRGGADVELLRRAVAGLEAIA